MKTAIIINTVADAKHCVEKAFYQDKVLFSTHASVDVYLNEYHDIDSRCLSAYVKTEDIHEIADLVSESVDLLVAALDESISESINRQFGLQMKWFEPLYSYLGRYQLLSYLCFVVAAKRAIRDNQLKRIFLYNAIFDGFFSTTSSLSDIICLLPKGIEYDLIEYSPDLKRKGNRFLFDSKFISIMKSTPTDLLIRTFRRLISFWTQKRYSRNKRTILCNFSYNLEFLKYSLSNKYNLLECRVFSKRKGNPFKIKGLAIPNIGMDLIDKGRFDDDQLTYVPILLKAINHDIQANINRYLESILALKAFNARNSISLGITGIPPIQKAESLCFEYLRTEKIKVLIGQHGCLYGEIHCPWHFISDYNRCDAFISYGFNRDDMKRVYLEQENYPEIYPCGYISPIVYRKKRTPIDLLFPITNTISMLNGGMSRIPPDRLVKRQVKLLKYLNTLINRNVYVKLFPYSDQENCAILPLLEKLHNLKIVNDMNLTRFLELFHPAAVLIEYPSQPLVEVIGLDTQIFLIPDDALPYEKIALEKLKKRVHYCETTEKSILKMDQFFQGNLERKENKSYFNHYVYKENSKDKILNIVNRFAESEA